MSANLLSSSVFSCEDTFLNNLGDGDWKPIGKIIRDKQVNTKQPFDLFRVDYINPLASKIVDCGKPDQITFESGIVNEIGSWDYIIKLYFNNETIPLAVYGNNNFILARRLEAYKYDVKGIEIDFINHILDEFGSPRVEIICKPRGLESYEVSSVKSFYKRTRYSSFYDQIKKQQEAEMQLREALASAMHTKLGFMPIIDDVYYNAPHTTVRWKDGTTTTVSCSEGEEFNKEFGLMAAISRKYFETLGMPYPRATLKKVVANAHDQTEKTAKRKAYKLAKKQKLLEAAKEEV